MTSHHCVAGMPAEKERRKAAALLAGLICVFFAVTGYGAASSATTSFPHKPVRIVVPFPPGGGSDFVARLIGQKLAEAWGQPVICDNRPGANATIGASIVAKAPPDAYTLLLATTELVIVPHFVTRLPYHPIKHFAAVSQTGRQSYILAAHPSLGVTTIKELIAALNARGGRVNFASSGTGSPGHLSGELFKLATGTQMTHIPYKGSGPALAALVGGETALMFSNSLPVLPHIRSGRLKGIAITSRQRLPSLRDLPTVAEGGVPGFETYGWTGILAPIGTPSRLLHEVRRQIVNTLSLTDVREQFARGDIEPVGSTPDEFRQHIAQELEKWTKVVKHAGISPE